MKTWTLSEEYTQLTLLVHSKRGAWGDNASTTKKDPQLRNSGAASKGTDLSQQESSHSSHSTFVEEERILSLTCTAVESPRTMRRLVPWFFPDSLNMTW